MAAGMNVFEDCSGSKYICNGLHSCFYGFYLDDKSVNNKMTDQGTWNGSNGDSWNNWWDNNYDDHVHGTVAPTCFFNWGYVSAADDPQPTNILPFYLTVNNVSNYIAGCSPPAFAIDDEERNKRYGAAVGDSTGSEWDSLEYSYNDKEAFYRDVKQDNSILYLGSPQDIFYQNKYAEYQNTDIGKFKDAIAFLSEDDKAAAIQKLQEMVQPDVISQNNYFMGSLLANGYDPNLDADSDTIALITNISFQHPFYGGEAVYLARTLLHQDVFDALPQFRRRYRENTGLASISSLDKFYPNPANKTVTFYSSIPFSEDEHLLLYNSYGTLLKQILLPKGQKYISFDTSDLKAGIYYTKVKRAVSERKSEKLVIIP